MPAKTRIVVVVAAATAALSLLPQGWESPDGKLATFEVKYTFGLDPLAYAERLARTAPDDPDVVALVERLRRQRSAPAPTR
jgi:hypothetical protein